jgi:hypothetical protein
MKKQLFYHSAMALAFAFALVSCSKNSTDTTTPASSLPAGINSATGWTISSFSQKGEDKTSSFTGFVFFFDTNGGLTVKNGSNTSSGTWLYSPSSVGYYGSSPSKASFNINIGAAEPLGRLTKTWNIDSTITSSNRLVLISPEVLENETVIFSKQ